MTNPVIPIRMAGRFTGDEFILITGIQYYFWSK